MQEGPIGDMILLDYYNKRTGKVEPMVDADVDLQCINHGRELPISDVHGNLQSNSISSEVITMSYSGLKLTYYKDDMGVMRVARENNGMLQEIATENLDDIEYEKQFEQSKRKIDKLNVILDKRKPEAHSPLDKMDPPDDKDPLAYDELDEMDPPGDDDPLEYDDPLAESELREETKRLNISEDTLKEYAIDYMTTKRYLDTRTDLSKGERDDWLEGEMYDSFLDMIVIKEEGLARRDEDIRILYEQYGKEFRDMVEGKMNEIYENARNVREDLFTNSKEVSVDEKQNIEMYEMREAERQEQENQEMVESRRGIR